jgi:hypothetical protein
MLRIGQVDQQLAALPRLRFRSGGRTALAVACGVYGPGSGSEQQCGVVIQARILPVQLIGFVEGGDNQVIPAEHDQRFRGADQRGTPQHRCDVVARDEDGTNRAERRCGLPQGDSAVGQLHV